MNCILLFCRGTYFRLSCIVIYRSKMKRSGTNTSLWNLIFLHILIVILNRMKTLGSDNFCGDLCRSASCRPQEPAGVWCHHQLPDHRLGPRRGPRQAVQDLLCSHDRRPHHWVCEFIFTTITTITVNNSKTAAGGVTMMFVRIVSSNWTSRSLCLRCVINIIFKVRWSFKFNPYPIFI